MFFTLDISLLCVYIYIIFFKNLLQIKIRKDITETKGVFAMKNTYSFLAAAAAGLLLTGCITEKTPLAISRGTFSEIKKEEHQTLRKGSKRCPCRMPGRSH